MAEHSRKKQATARKATPKSGTKSSPVEETDEAAEQAHLESLIASGQAARPDAQGNLPPGATHKIVDTPEGKLKAVRRRYSAY